MRKAKKVLVSEVREAGEDDEAPLKVVDYEKFDNSAVAVTDRLKIQASDEDVESLKKAMAVLSRFESLVLSEFHSQRGYAANDIRYSDTFKEIHFWFKDGHVMASIRAGSVG